MIHYVSHINPASIVSLIEADQQWHLSHRHYCQSFLNPHLFLRLWRELAESAAGNTAGETQVRGAEESLLLLRWCSEEEYNFSNRGI